MSLLLIVALCACIAALWRLPEETPGLLLYLAVQVCASAVAIAVWVLYGLDSQAYRQVHYAGQGMALFCAVVLTGAMLARYPLQLGVTTFAVALLLGALLPTLLALHLKGPYRGALPVGVTVILWLAGAYLFCGLAALLSLVPPTLAPMPTYTRLILGAMFASLGVYQMAYLTGSATKHTASWQAVNEWLPVTVETAAFGALALLATLQGEVSRAVTEATR